jgi:hypothetical protein
MLGSVHLCPEQRAIQVKLVQYRLEVAAKVEYERGLTFCLLDTAPPPTPQPNQPAGRIPI